LALPKIFDPDEEQVLLVSIQVFCDESGKVGDSKNVVVAACVASPESWAALAEKWKFFVNRAGISGIGFGSMKDAVHFKNSFAGWRCRVAERDELLAELAGLVAHYGDMLTASYVATSAWNAMPEQRKRKMKNPVYALSEGVILQIVEHSSAAIQLCFDSCEEYAPTWLSLYHALRRNSPEFKRRCGNITFGEDEFFIGLQVADMYAYCVREILDRGDKATPLVRRLNSILEERKPHEDLLQYHPLAGLGQGKLIVRAPLPSGVS
jgi:hypothetical protein